MWLDNKEISTQKHFHRSNKPRLGKLLVLSGMYQIFSGTKNLNNLRKILEDVHFILWSLKIVLNYPVLFLNFYSI